MKKTAVIISIIIHLTVLFLVLPLNNENTAIKKEPYEYLSINAVLLNNQPEELIDVQPPAADEELNENIIAEEINESFIIAEQDKEAGTVPDNSQDSGETDNNRYDYYPLSMVQIKPSLIEKAEFIFPRAARRNDISEATVIIEIILNEKGEIVECMVAESAGYGFDEAVLDMFKNARFSPAYIDNKPVPVKVRIPVQCRLEE